MTVASLATKVVNRTQTCLRSTLALIAACTASALFLASPLSCGNCEHRACGLPAGPPGGPPGIPAGGPLGQPAPLAAPGAPGGGPHCAELAVQGAIPPIRANSAKAMARLRFM